METGSYLLVGVPEGAQTFFSTAHGSGRTMSRTKARKQWRGEKLQREMAAAQARVREAETAFEREQRLLNESDTALSKELALLDEQQRHAAAAVPRNLLERYEKLKAQRKDLALASVRDGTCQGCRLQLPPQLVAEVKRSDELQVCGYCHRILYWEGELPAEAPATTGSSHDYDDEAGESL